MIKDKKLIADSSARGENKPVVGRSAVYVLSTNWGQFLESVTQSGGTLIFSYTRRIFDAHTMNKNKADCYCSLKNFFKQMKIAQ